MLFLVVFIVIAAVIVVPAIWICSFAGAMGGGRSSDAIWLALGATGAIAVQGAGAVSGIWSLLAPLFGG